MPNFDLSALFIDGKEINTEQGRVTLRRREIAPLHVTTNSIVACDPGSPDDAEAFTQAVAPGTYPVTLSVATYEDDDQRVAGAMLRFSEAAPVRWSIALLPDEDESQLGVDEIFGYTVESAHGCFMDSSAAISLLRCHEEYENFDDAIAAELDKAYVDTWSYADIKPDPESEANIVVFSSGMGDGLYASYFGFDADDNPVCLATDFSLFSEDEMT